MAWASMCLKILAMVHGEQVLLRLSVNNFAGSCQDCVALVLQILKTCVNFMKHGALA